MNENTANIAQEDDRKPLGMIIRYALTVFAILFLLYVLLNVVPAYLEYSKLFSEPSDKDKFISKIDHLVTQVELISSYAWSFFQPLLQLTLLLYIVEWIFKKFGINIFSKDHKFEWSVQTIIALIIISAFAIAALGGISGADSLKDLALVVVGFYFGSQNKTTETDDINGKSSPAAIENNLSTEKEGTKE